MGIIISKLRKKKTTEEVLEKLDKEIKTIEAYRINTEQTQKKIVGRFILISVIVYSLAAFLFYFYFFPASFYDRLFYIIPLLFVPSIIICTKKGLTWYYRRIISKDQSKLKKLNDEKKKILENVMETETYKKAKTILEKYAPEHIRKNSFPVPSIDAGTPIKNNSLTTITPTTVSGLRHRIVSSSHLQPSQPFKTPYSGYQTPSLMRPPASAASHTVARISTSSLGITPSLMMPSGTIIPGTPLPLPGMILSRDRTVFDRMVDYLFKEGPSNRYALICKQCSSHNGMVLQEEYEYLSFRCCYCQAFNPSRKKRPAAPKLEIDSRQRLSIEAPDTSESEKNSSSDTESDEQQLTMTQMSRNVETLYPKEPPSSDSDKNDFDKLSDAEFKTSDNESTPMEVDQVRPIVGEIPINTEEIQEKSNDEIKEEIKSGEGGKGDDNIDVKS